MAQGRSFPNDDRQRVLDATDIVRLVGEHVQLRAKGREFVCVCPFHDDHKPSMYVVPAKQIYHCFSCGAGGNALDFAINYFKMDFREALKFLADRAGLELTPWKPAGADANRPGDPEEPRSSRAQLFEAATFAHEFFRAILRHPEHGAAARETIQKRGIAPEMVDEFGLGASPDRWDGLERTIANRKMDPAPFVTLGLLKKRERESGSYDALRHRLIFPIHDQIGRVIGFGGRKMRDEDEPKYLNSPESPLFDKGRNLYGLHLARKAIQDSKTVVVTEGYTDVIACHQHGVRNVVATLGTALTREHGRLLERLCDTVILLFDADEAGQRAADRALEVFFSAPVDVKICVLPGGKDPDELLSQDGGAERFQHALANAKDALDYRFERLAEKAAGVGMSGVARLIEGDAQRLQELGFSNLDPIRRRKVIRRLSSIAGVPEHDIELVLRRATPRAVRRESDDAPAAVAEPIRHGLPERALGALLVDPTLANDLRDEELGALESHAFTHAAVAEVAQTLFARLHDGDDCATASLNDAMPSQPARDAMRVLMLDVQFACEGSRDRLLICARDAIARLDARTALSVRTDPNDRLARLRDDHARRGRNPTAFPRPTTVAPPT
ncbi:MAG: DNA primase [Phycisphaerales bacterium]